MAARIGSGEDSAAQWEANWRADVTRQLRESGEAHQQSALILERLGNRLDEHDRRIGILESRPDKLRESLGTYGGCSSSAIYVALGAFNTLLGLCGTVLAIVAYFHH